MNAAAIDPLDAILCGEQPPWTALRTTSRQLLDECAAREISALVHHKLSHFKALDWPADVRAELARAAHSAAATELVRSREIATALDALAQHDVRPILLKGAALAHTVYDAAAVRPRADTDLLIRREDIEVARRVMRQLGYADALQSQGELLFCQFEMIKRDAFGIEHAFDFHWKISTQQLFADVLGYAELAAAATPVRTLGAQAIGPGDLHALLLACIHPVMHHRNTERLIWLYDIHLLASRLSADGLERFARLAIDKGMRAICARQLRSSAARFGTPLPVRLMASPDEGTASEASAVYLKPGRRWHHELVHNLRSLPGFRDRLRLLREILLPNPTYLLKSYGATGAWAVALPALYVLRIAQGIRKVLAGRK
jgi:hypothetical protein